MSEQHHVAGRAAPIAASDPAGSAGDGPAKVFMRGIAVGLSSLAPAAPAPTDGIRRSESLGCVGMAYRAGRLVCGCVHVTISLDERLGLTEHERRVVRVRFHEPVADDLRNELHQLVRRRGRASDRAAGRVAGGSFIPRRSQIPA
jgi:hypothetical protein